MDEVISWLDTIALDDVYGPKIARDNLWRQTITLYVLVAVGGALLYLVTAWLNYLFIFDRKILSHKLYKEGQMRKEIEYALSQIPGMAALTVPIFLLELHGYSKLYDRVDEYGWSYLLKYLFISLMFIDFGIYWAHRFLHWGPVYRNVHKPHHQWLVMTPFSSHSFHFLDGFLQSLSYHVAVFLFPMQKWVYFGLFFFVNIWSVFIHDEVNYLPDWAQNYINGSMHHADHHLYFNYNFGQYLTLWDRIGGTHRNPRPNQLPIMQKELDMNDVPDCDKKEIEVEFGEKEGKKTM